MKLRDLLYREDCSFSKDFVQNYFQLKGSYSGKIYYKSWYSSKKKLDQYLDLETFGLFPSIEISSSAHSKDFAFAVTTIWISDYEIATKKKDKVVEDD